MTDARTHRIAVIAGDGVGLEVVPAGQRVLERAADGFRLEWTDLPWGSEHYAQTGRMMPADALETLSGFDAIYLGAVGSPDVPDDVTLWGLLLPMRQHFDLYVNLRPVRLLPGVESPLRNKGAAEIDMVCVRENTEGEYSGVGGRAHAGHDHEVAIQTDVFTRRGVERVARYAFELARGRRKRLASITKSNASPYAFVFWDVVVNEVARDYPDVEVERLLVDAAAAYMITSPERFDVLVASNLFGDILTDIGAAIQGGMGLAASANLNPDDASAPGLFEPVHGSAPDIAGQGLANPVGTIWAGAEMLRSLGEEAAAQRVMAALEQVLGAREVRTRDLGGEASTTEVADAVVAAIG